MPISLAVHASQTGHNSHDSQTENLNIEVAKLHAELFRADKNLSIERRIKVLTDGSDDTADPCVPIQLTLPDGRKIWALYFSGGRVVHYSSLHDLLRGGIHSFHKIQVQTKDGEPLVMEPYHLAEAIWDTELVLYRDSHGVERYIGHGGMMEREAPGVPCSVAHHNFRRSRHSFEVKFHVDFLSQKVTEVWKNLGPIHGNKPTKDGRWISRNEDQAHAHGYGSRMIRNSDGNPWQDTQGFMWMTYEEVTEETVRSNGERIPFGTKIFARRMNHDLSLALGNAVLLSSYSPWQNLDRPFRASCRQDVNGTPSGFLIEGPNPILLNIDGKEYWTIFFSAGDFVAEYGNYMMYREKSEGPIGPYRHVIDPNSELINLTDEIVKKYDLTWAGRLNCFYDHQGLLWGLMHGIFKSDLPNDWVKSGWPRSQQEFIGYARRVFLVPLNCYFLNNQPIVKVSEKY